MMNNGSFLLESLRKHRKKNSVVLGSTTQIWVASSGSFNRTKDTLFAFNCALLKQSRTNNSHLYIVSYCSMVVTTNSTWWKFHIYMSLWQLEVIKEWFNFLIFYKRNGDGYFNLGESEFQNGRFNSEISPLRQLYRFLRAHRRNVFVDL